MSKRPTLCVVAGPNGSGKTSTTIQLLENEWSEGSVYINPDNIAKEEFGDWNSPDAVFKAAKKATELRYHCLEERKDFVFAVAFHRVFQQHRRYGRNNADGHECFWRKRYVYRWRDFFKIHADGRYDFFQAITFSRKTGFFSCVFRRRMI